MDIANVLFGFSAQRLAKTPSKSLPPPVLGCPCHWGFTHQLQLALAVWWRRLPGSPALFLWLPEQPGGSPAYGAWPSAFSSTFSTFS